MKNLIILFALMLVQSLACSQPQTNSQSEWSELYYHYQTGSVAPQYYYSYDMTIGPDGTTTLVYHPGYQADSTWTYQFKLTEDALNNLNQGIKNSGVLTETITEAPLEHRSIGGPIQNVTIVLPQDPNLDQVPRRIITPGFPEEKYKEKLNTLYEIMQKLIPEATWKEIEVRKGTK